MLTFYQYKPTFQNHLRPLVGWLAQRQVSPNQITSAAMLLSMVMGGATALFPQSHWMLLALPLVLFIRMALNAIDGMLARDYCRTTPLGYILNEAGDVVSDAALYLPFCLIPGTASLWIVIIVLLASLTELVGVLGQAIADKRCYQGPMGKSDRAFIFGSIALLLGLGFEVTHWLTGVWIGVILLQLVTIFNRIRATLRATAKEVES
jgi:CDP-diacylglycerol--glycerol-3-phosphate 3-phosphatidyltransferase